MKKWKMTAYKSCTDGDLPVIEIEFNAVNFDYASIMAGNLVPRSDKVFGAEVDYFEVSEVK